MLGDSSPFEPEVQKEGTLQKLGGGAGGHKNWKDRYFVLTDHLYYYGSKAEYTKDPKAPLGRINLLSYYVAPSDPDTHEFCVHAYPKVRGLQGHWLGPAPRLPYLPIPLLLLSLTPPARHTPHPHTHCYNSP